MTSAVHDEGGFSGYRTVPANDELVPDEIEMIKDVLEEPRRTIRIIVIGIIANDDIGAGAKILDKTNLWKPFHGMS